MCGTLDRRGDSFDAGKASKAMHCICNNPHLIAILHDSGARESNPKVFGSVLTILGELKCTNVVDEVAALLLYNMETGRNYGTKDWETIFRKHGDPAGGALALCPAFNALYIIGKPSVEPLLRELASGRWDGDAKVYAHYLMLCIFQSVIPAEGFSSTLAEFKKKLNSTESINRVNDFFSFCEKRSFRE